jgi:hypothetical protein
LHRRVLDVPAAVLNDATALVDVVQFCHRRGGGWLPPYVMGAARALALLAVALDGEGVVGEDGGAGWAADD